MATCNKCGSEQAVKRGIVATSKEIGVRNVVAIFEKGMDEPMKKTLRKKRFASCFMP